MPNSLVDVVSEKAEALVGAPDDFNSVIDLIGDARFVLIGEASHGTHEFYRIRAQISKTLIAQRGFSAVAVEADWPDAYRVNRFVRSASKDNDSVEALSGFQRFPQWMWRNADVLDFVGWLRERGELNLGQIVREHFGKEAVSIGFTTYDGTVTAASDWDGPAERKKVRPAHRESYEALFHEVDVPNFFLGLRDDADLATALRNERLERAIGVIYRPETELMSHYFHARLPDQFDAILHYDHTRSVEPLERTAEWEMGEVEETFPSGL